MRHLLAALALALSGIAATPATAADLAVQGAWTRETLKGSDGAVVYLTVVNSGSSPDALVGLSTPIAKAIHLHTMGAMPGMMTMQSVAAIPIPAHSTVQLKPMGAHAMIAGLVQPLSAGQTFPLSLRFERAGVVTVTVQVQGLGGPQEHMHDMHDMHGM